MATRRAVDAKRPSAPPTRTGAVTVFVLLLATVGCTSSGASRAPAETATTSIASGPVSPGAPDASTTSSPMTSPTTPGPPTTTLPLLTDTDVGPDPSVELRDADSATILAGGTYSHVRVKGSLEIPADAPATSFTQCRIEGTIVTYSPVNLRSCVVTGGLYAYDTSGEISHSLLLGSGQAFRPGTADPADAFTTPTPWVVTDTVIRISPGVPPAHVEASQVLGGVGITFRNVVFDSSGPFNNTQTADLNFRGSGLRCEDCAFVGFGGYSVYAIGSDNVFIRPVFGRNDQFGLVYPSDDPALTATFLDPRYIDGSPAAITRAG